MRVSPSNDPDIHRSADRSITSIITLMYFSDINVSNSDSCGRCSSTCYDSCTSGSISRLSISWFRISRQVRADLRESEFTKVKAVKQRLAREKPLTEVKRDTQGLVPNRDDLIDPSITWDERRKGPRSGTPRRGMQRGTGRDRKRPPTREGA